MNEQTTPMGGMPTEPQKDGSGAMLGSIIIIIILIAGGLYLWYSKKDAGTTVPPASPTAVESPEAMAEDVTGMEVELANFQGSIESADGDIKAMGEAIDAL
jgi:hypothetical protein